MKTVYLPQTKFAGDITKTVILFGCVGEIVQNDLYQSPGKIEYLFHLQYLDSSPTFGFGNDSLETVSLPFKIFLS